MATMLAQLLALKDYVLGTPPKNELHSMYGGANTPGNVRSPLFSEDVFTKLLCLERRRAERSRKPFALMLVDASRQFLTNHRESSFSRLLLALSSSIRETDIWGWQKEGAVIGVILTEIGSADATALCKTMRAKLRLAFLTNLEPRHLEGIHISFQMFPQCLGSQDGNGGSGETNLNLYPDLQPENDRKKGAKLLKRVIDVFGSLTALALLSPVFLLIAIAIKLTSKGSVLFKQKRVGQYGVEFTFVKFRSMYFDNDPRIHQDYVRQLIAGRHDCKQPSGVYKLQHDPRITPLGRFLRRTSLDEIPQFFNVLRGDMSLVGPRPPLPYEAEAYDIWHRRRFFEAKPGITGLWQVRGRSKVTFEEMVRLDIRYMRDWSIGLDLKILFETPRVVLFGKGAH
jgi:lipopolysaccharide/colanic/teichoic acid biosynthesis glycosyltransferase